jgi:hypothetical protein
MKQHTIFLGRIRGIPIGLDYSWFLIFGLITWTALKEMDRDGVNQLPVMGEGVTQGMLGREDIISYLRTLKEFGA